MALIMLAIGGLLALAGVYAMATGFPIIEVERGWSMVISGAVLLSGGLIVASLGIVVRTLKGLATGLPAAATGTASSQDLTTEDPRFLDPEPGQATIPVRPPAPPVTAENMPAFAVVAPAMATAVAEDAAAHHEAAPHETVADSRHEPMPPVEDHAAFDHAVAGHAAPDHPMPHEDEAPTEPPGRDWLDKEFAAFDLDAQAPHPAVAHEPEPNAAPPEQEPDALVPATREAIPIPHQADEPAPREDAAHHLSEHGPTPEPVADAPATAPETPPANLSVIGRYDSDGTSYVMYSDGSIEAQSDAGVFRFSSMAELKAFIEG